jgi:hypothetical protein
MPTINRGTATQTRVAVSLFSNQIQENHMTTDTSQSDPQPSKDSWIAKHQDHARRVTEARPANKAVLFDALARTGHHQGRRQFRWLRRQRPSRAHRRPGGRG